MIKLLDIPARPLEAVFIRRATRFTLRVLIDGKEQLAYLANPGRLEEVLTKGRTFLLLPQKRIKRRTSFDVFAAKLNSFFVTLRSAFANDLFEAAILRGALPSFAGYSIVGREVEVGSRKRLDFVLEGEGQRLLVEVKSCTYVENGVARFPDCPTRRGREHVRALADATRRGKKCCLVFVVQRPDANSFMLFKEMDPEFAQLLREAQRAGLSIKAFSTMYDASSNAVYMLKPSLPIKL